MWERGWSFIKKAGTIILLSTIVLWFLMGFGWERRMPLAMVEELEQTVILAKIGSAIAWIFAPLGWTKAGEGWKMAVAAVTGLIAKENVVATFGMLFGFAEVAEDGAEIWGNLAQVMTPIAAYGYPGIQPSVCSMLRSYGCHQERDEQHKMVLVCNRISVWTGISCIPVHLSDRYPGNRRWIWYLVQLCAFVIIAGFLYLLFRPYKESNTLKVNVKGLAGAK